MVRAFNRISQTLRRHFFSSTPATENRSPLARYLDPRSLLPEDRLLRLGTVYGGWLLPKNHGLTERSICYSAGAGEDISFDCELAKRFHCRVRIFDPTPRAIEHFERLAEAVRLGRRFAINHSESECYELDLQSLERLSFLPVGLSNQDTEVKFYLPKDSKHVSCSIVNLQKTTDYFVAQCHRLSTIKEQRGDKEIELLKMDIEGAEYSVISDMVATRELPPLLLIEFDEGHTPLDSNAGDRIQNHIMQLIRAGMRCVAVEGSNATFVRTW